MGVGLAYEEARSKISKELVWKVWVEEACAWERRHLRAGSEAHARNARECMRHAVNTCPKNLAWKVFLAGARMEVRRCEPRSDQLSRLVLIAQLFSANTSI